MQAKFVLLLALASVFCVSHVRGQSESGGDGPWARLKALVKQFVDSFRKMWDEMKAEIKARAGDMSSWTREMLDSFKVKMREWVDSVSSGASDSEKEDMRNYIERLQLPNEQR